MTASRPDNEAIFHAARDIPDPERRRAYVREACGGDETRIAHVEALLAAANTPDSLLDRPAGSDPVATFDQHTTQGPGTVIGPYNLLEQIGEGGMGTVWMAQQTEPVRRLVALKLIKAGMDSKQVIARFEAERQALALMDHPYIARVLDGGTTSGGRPYFVMDLVKGVPITKYCDEHHLTPRQRLELFVPVCHAIQHAHQKGIIHRDLKPSNVLVALYDGKPVPKVIDFGVAKAAGQSLTEKTLVTGFGNIVGTLEYMSPEQAEVNQLDIDTRSDIYSLGVLLYELLTGSPPFTRKELEKAGMLEMLRVIREQEPSKPSTKLSTAEGLPTLAANRGTEPAKLTKMVRGELDWIVMKALEKDRNRRYETANGFAMDVQRYLADEAVLACPPSVAYRFRKFARRNKVALLTGTVVAAAVVAVAVVASLSAYWLSQEQQATRDQLHQTQQAELREKRNFEEANDQRNTADEQRQRAENLAEDNRKHLVRALVGHGVRLMDEGDPFGALPWFAEALTRDQDDPERMALHRTRMEMILRQSPRLAQVWFRNALSFAVFSPDGRYVVLVCHGPEGVRVWNVATGEPVGPRLASSALVGAVCFSRDGRRVLVAYSDYGPMVYDTVSAKAAFRLEHPAAYHAEFSADGSRILTADGSSAPTVRVWDGATGQLLAKHFSKNPSSSRNWAQAVRAHNVLISPDGRHVLTMEQEPEGATVRVRDVATGKAICQLGAGQKYVEQASFSPDGRRVLTSRFPEPPELWDAQTGVRVAVLGDRLASRMFYNATGSRIVTMTGDQTGALMPAAHASARVWDAATGLPVSPDIWHPTRINCACIDPTGLFMATGCADGKVRIWNADKGRLAAPVLHHAAEVRHVAFSPDGRQLLSTGVDQSVRIWELWGPRLAFAALVGKPAPYRGTRLLAFSPDSRRLLTAGFEPNPARIWDLATKRPVDLRHGADVYQVAYSPDGRHVLTIGVDRTARVWDASSGNPVGEPLKHDAPILDGAFHPKGDSFVTTGVDGAARIWHVGTGQLALPALIHKSPEVRSATYSADGQRLLTVAGRPRLVSNEGRVWNANTGESLMTLDRGHIAMSPMGDRFAVDGFVTDVRVTNHLRFFAEVLESSGEKMAVAPLGHSGRLRHVAFSPDGRRIVTSSEDGTARVWDALTGNAVTGPLPHQEFVLHASFSADGKRLATVRLWNATSGEPLSLPFSDYNILHPMAFSADGRLLASAWPDDCGLSVRVWDVSPGDRPVSELVQWAELLAANRRDPSGNLVPLTPGELESRWQKCKPAPPKK